MIWENIQNQSLTSMHLYTHEQTWSYMMDKLGSPYHERHLQQAPLGVHTCKHPPPPALEK